MRRKIFGEEEWKKMNDEFDPEMNEYMLGFGLGLNFIPTHTLFISIISFRGGFNYKKTLINIVWIRKVMSIEENIEIGRRMMEVVNNQDPELLDDLLIPEYENQQLKVRSREDIKQILKRQYRAFPDVLRTMVDIIADEDSVWIRVKITGTHTGEYRGIAPTGKKFVMEAVPSYRIVDGLIVEGWSVWNPLDLFKQLGVIEYKGFPDEVKQPL